jgi:hypothetical protein
MFRPEESMLLRKVLRRCLRVRVLDLCYSQTYSVMELRFGMVICSPRSLSKIMRTFLSWGRIVLFYTDS